MTIIKQRAKNWKHAGMAKNGQSQMVLKVSCPKVAMINVSHVKQFIVKSIK